jgi:hypothetical protein
MVMDYDVIFLSSSITMESTYRDLEYTMEKSLKKRIKKICKIRIKFWFEKQKNR